MIPYKRLAKAQTLAALATVAAVCALGAAHAFAEEINTAPPADTFRLWQLPNQTTTQMMSYVLLTRHGQAIILDGGMIGDAPYLRDFIQRLGNVVTAWFITHAHDDHFGALGEMLRQPNPPDIKALYGSLPDQNWVDSYGPPDEKIAYRRFLEALKSAGKSIEELTLGQCLDIDGIRFETLGVKNPEITKNPINNSSLVLRASDEKKSVLFLADLGVDGGKKILESPLAARLPSDYVQMAHHGQNGVTQSFYQAVRPTYCLWPTPKWLWDNDNGGGPNSGHWQTLIVRRWMEELSIKTHFVLWEGLKQID